MASGKPSRSSATGRDPHAKVTGPLEFTRLCRERLGVGIPVGEARRGVWYKQLADEMQIQGWTWDDMVRAVDYIVERQIHIRVINGVLHFVEEARRDERETSVDDVHVKVAEALAVEKDEYWRRRLSLAQGKTLERVYQEWKAKSSPDAQSPSTGTTTASGDGE